MSFSDVEHFSPIPISFLAAIWPSILPLGGFRDRTGYEYVQVMLALVAEFESGRHTISAGMVWVPKPSKEMW